MRLLFLSQYYPPEPATQRQQMAEDLVERGHVVTSITAFPNYPLGAVYPGYKQCLWRWERISGARVLRLPLFPDHSRSGVRRGVSYLSFAASASILGPALCGAADVMWVYAPPLTTGIPAWWISRLRRIPFVFEVQDLWPETLVATGMMRSRTALRALGALAGFIYRAAAAIVVSSPGMRDNLVGKGVPKAKIHVIPNWVDDELFRPLRPNPAIAQSYGLTGKFNVMFAGNLGLAQGIETVIRAADLLRDLRGVQFVLVGDGVQETHLKEMVAALHLNNVIFLGRQPLELMPELFALADVLLGHLKRDPLFTITIPSKTIAYLACGRPIVMAVEGDATDVIREAGAGLCCEPESPRALADAIRRLRDMTVSQRAGLGEAGRDYFRNRFARRILVPQYERLFAEASGVLRQIGDTPEERRGKCSPEDAEPSSGTRQAPRGD